VAGPRKPQEAYKWFSLAEARGFKRASEVRDAIGKQLNAAQRRAADLEISSFAPVSERGASGSVSIPVPQLPPTQVSAPPLPQANPAPIPIPAPSPGPASGTPLQLHRR